MDRESLAVFGGRLAMTSLRYLAKTGAWRCTMSETPTVFTCADDKAARSTVIALAKEIIGFEGVDAGHLDASRNVENLGLLVGQLAYGSGFGDRVSLRAYVAS